MSRETPRAFYIQTTLHMPTRSWINIAFSVFFLVAALFILQSQGDARLFGFDLGGGARSRYIKAGVYVFFALYGFYRAQQARHAVDGGDDE